MPTFQALNRDWSIRFDGLLLDELRTAHGIDLADVTGETYVKVETDQATLTKAVCFLCREQLDQQKLDARALAGSLVGETAEAALQAIWGAAKVFFRPKLWSALESACAQRKMMAELRPLLETIETLPAGMREAAMEQLAAKISGSLPASEEPSSASGPAVTPSTPAIDSLDSAVLAPAA